MVASLPLMDANTRASCGFLRDLMEPDELRLFFGRGEDQFGVSLDSFVTFAGRGLEAGSIKNLDLTTAVSDQPCGLQFASDQCQRRSSHTEHLSKKILRQRQSIAVIAISRLEQPAAKAGLEG